MNAEKKTNGRGKLFYKLWGAFLVTTLVCAIIITFQYIRSLNERESQMEESYSRMAVNVSGNLGSLVEQFEQYGRVLVENQGMEEFRNVISAEAFPYDSADARRLWDRFNIFLIPPYREGKCGLSLSFQQRLHFGIHFL